MSGFSIDSQGWLTGARHVPSPNFNQRPASAALSLLVIHNISLPPGQFGGAHICDFFTNCLDADAHPYFREIADLRVSAHLLIQRDGGVVQFVSFHDRAWHAGQSCFDGAENCNDFSLGIELEGSDDQPYTDQQYHCLAALVRVLLAHYPGLSKQRIVGHSDIAPGRKTDPGPCFDWRRLSAALEA
ncbi:1,6-anhydro-N-acetylmuramyl-L-alanine amidase AmpD [Porticoccus sp.]|uniref:1,6-anhydro-N-acetylmuramyl-L-alanine amidase AmpD n=1 Tax=Porticoccus sp. TaxID=2024853 RepID=UPI003F69E8D4